MPLAAKRIKRGIAFSKANHDEIRQMIERLIGNTRAAAAVFMTDDPQTARRLIGEKEVFRELETRVTAAVFERGDAHSNRMESRRLQLDIVRDLKRVNAHLAAAKLIRTP